MVVFIRSNRNPKTINNCGKRRECVWIMDVEGSSQGLEDDAPRPAGMWREDEVQVSRRLSGEKGAGVGSLTLQKIETDWKSGGDGGWI